MTYIKSADSREAAMPKDHILNHVPWTCRWGRFDADVAAVDVAVPGFHFWKCAHPSEEGRGVLPRHVCDTCPHWEQARRPVPVSAA